MNKVILMGFVGTKPEKRGERVVVLRLATHRRGYTKQDGTVVPDVADWHNVTIFDSKIGDFCLQYVEQGSALIVEGEIRYTSYTDANGIERRGTEIVATSVSFPSLGRKRDKETEESSPTEITPSIPADDLPF